MLTRITGAAVAASLALLLAACGGVEDKPAEGTDEVASLATPAASASSSAAPVPTERPLLRPDATQEEEDRLYDVYWTCLTDHGVPGYSKAADGTVESAPKPAAPAQGGREEDPAALAACAPLEPEAPWERARRTDPRYADKLRDWITCVRSHGIEAFEEDGFLAFDSLPGEEGMRHVDQCEMKAFNVA